MASNISPLSSYGDTNSIATQNNIKQTRLVVATLFVSVILTVVLCLQAAGVLTMGSAAAFSLLGIDIALVSAQVVGALFFIRKVQEQKSKKPPLVVFSQTVLPPNKVEEQKSPPLVVVSQTVPPPNTVETPEAWAARLQEGRVDPKKDTKELPYCYNLSTSGEDIALCCQPAFGVYRIPLLWSYDNELFSQLALGVRLPSSQLQAFPPAIQKWFAQEKLTHIELYFSIYIDTTGDSPLRNLTTHVMHIANEYDSQRKQLVDIDVHAGLFDPIGCTPPPARSPFYLQPNTILPFCYSVHEVRGSDMLAYSPNSCILTFDKNTPLPSFFFASTFRQQAVACYTIVLRNVLRDVQEANADGVDVQEANADRVMDAIHNSSNLQEFLESINALNLYFYPVLQKLFSYHPASGSAS